MKENGKTIKKKEKVLYIIIMVINLKENGKTIKKKEKEYFIMVMEKKK